MDLQDIGSELFTNGPPRNPPPSPVYGSKDKQRLVLLPEEDTTRSLLDSPELSDLLKLSHLSGLGIGRKLARRQQRNMYGRRQPLSKERDSRLVGNRSEETPQRTGMRFWNRLREENLMRSPVTYKFVIIGRYGPLLQTLRSQLESSKRFMCFMEQPELESLNEPGKKLVQVLTLKIHERNGGTGIKVRKMLLSMSFAELSMSHIYLDGLTVTQCVWKEKDLQWPCERLPFGLHPILHPLAGIQN